MHDKELELWREAAGINIEAKGPHFDLIQRIDNVMSKGSDVLSQDDFDGTECEVIPRGEFLYYDNSGEKPTRVRGQAFFARPTHLQERSGPFEEREEPYIFAYIKPDVSGSVQYALKLDVLRGTITSMGEDSLELESEEYIQKILYTSIESAKQKVNDLIYAKEYRKKVRKERTRRVILRGLGVTALATVLAGVVYAGTRIYNGIQDGKEQKREEIRNFDDSNYQIDGGRFELSSGKMATISLSEFERIPVYEDGDDLYDARRIEVPDEECKTLHTVVPSNISLNIGVKSNEPYQAEPVGFSRNQKGELVVCSFSNFGPDDDHGDAVGIAVQIHDKQ